MLRETGARLLKAKAHRSSPSRPGERRCDLSPFPRPPNAIVQQIATWQTNDMKQHSTCLAAGLLTLLSRHRRLPVCQVSAPNSPSSSQGGLGGKRRLLKGSMRGSPRARRARRQKEASRAHKACEEAAAASSQLHNDYPKVHQQQKGEKNEECPTGLIEEVDRLHRTALGTSAVGNLHDGDLAVSGEMRLVGFFSCGFPTCCLHASLPSPYFHPFD